MALASQRRCNVNYQEPLAFCIALGKKHHHDPWMIHRDLNNLQWPSDLIINQSETTVTMSTSRLLVQLSICTVQTDCILRLRGPNSPEQSHLRGGFEWNSVLVYVRLYQELKSNYHNWPKCKIVSQNCVSKIE